MVEVVSSQVVLSETLYSTVEPGSLAPEHLPGQVAPLGLGQGAGLQHLVPGEGGGTAAIWDGNPC